MAPKFKEMDGIVVSFHGEERRKKIIHLSLPEPTVQDAEEGKYPISSKRHQKWNSPRRSTTTIVISSQIHSNGYPTLRSNRISIIKLH